MNNKTMNNVNPAEHDVFQIIDGVSELVLTARRLKAVTNAFAETFTDNETGVDVDEIRNRPEHFCYLFDALRELVFAVEEQATAADDKGREYLAMKRQQGAGSRTAPATAQEGEQATGKLEASTASAQAV